MAGIGTSPSLANEIAQTKYPAFSVTKSYFHEIVNGEVTQKSIAAKASFVVFPIFLLLTTITLITDLVLAVANCCISSDSLNEEPAPSSQTAPAANTRSISPALSPKTPPAIAAETRTAASSSSSKTSELGPRPALSVGSVRSVSILTPAEPAPAPSTTASKLETKTVLKTSFQMTSRAAVGALASSSHVKADDEMQSHPPRAILVPPVKIPGSEERKEAHKSLQPKPSSVGQDVAAAASAPQSSTASSIKPEEAVGGKPADASSSDVVAEEAATPSRTALCPPLPYSASTAPVERDAAPKSSTPAPASSSNDSSRASVDLPQPSQSPAASHIEPAVDAAGKQAAASSSGDLSAAASAVEPEADSSAAKDSSVVTTELPDEPQSQAEFNLQRKSIRRRSLETTPPLASPSSLLREDPVSPSRKLSSSFAENFPKGDLNSPMNEASKPALDFAGNLALVTPPALAGVTAEENQAPKPGSKIDFAPLEDARDPRRLAKVIIHEPVLSPYAKHVALTTPPRNNQQALSEQKEASRAASPAQQEASPHSSASTATASSERSLSKNEESGQKEASRAASPAQQEASPHSSASTATTNSGTPFSESDSLLHSVAKAIASTILSEDRIEDH